MNERKLKKILTMTMKILVGINNEVKYVKYGH